MRRETYTNYTDDCQESRGELLPFKAWCSKKGEIFPKFKYWHMVYDMELLLLHFVCSIHVGDFDLCEDLDERSQIGLLFLITTIMPDGFQFMSTIC